MRKDDWQSLDPGPALAAERIPVLVQNILDLAKKLQASDVHIQPSIHALNVDFRVDGVLHHGPGFPKELAPNVVARLKVLADLLSYRQDIPQEGRLRSKESSDPMEVRVSTFPTIHGERVAIRIFRKDSKTLEIHDLGMDPEVCKTLTAAMDEKTGAILFTGPGGSGKTTTIYSCLKRIQAQFCRRHIVTLEDPVEQVLDGISQSEIRSHGEMDFASGLRSLLRQDPEVIMVGEIRDSQTARVAIEAALSGHLLFSTFHAGSSAGVISRLVEMGLEPHLLTSALRLIVNQRLLRKSCPNCRAEGCQACNHTGFLGRLLLAEVMVPEGEIRKAVLRCADRNELEDVFGRAGGKNLRQQALKALEKGLTTKEEIIRVLGIDGYSSASSVDIREHG